MYFDEFVEVVRPYTMTSIERVKCLYDCLEKIRINNIKGDFVECGVWKGGNVLGILRYLEYHNMTENNVWLYDTFNGMTMPDDNDVDLHGQRAEDIFGEVLCMNSLEEVQSVIDNNTKYPKDKIKYVVGDICKTLLNKDNVPEKIALLRLDTDWYESTKIELEVLWDKVEIGAPCIIDDYGHWQGCKKAVDEFFMIKPCVHKFGVIDYTGIVTNKVC